jgi:hypothetical protein
VWLMPRAQTAIAPNYKIVGFWQQGCLPKP